MLVRSVIDEECCNLTSEYPVDVTKAHAFHLQAFPAQMERIGVALSEARSAIIDKNFYDQLKLKYVSSGFVGFSNVKCDTNSFRGLFPYFLFVLQIAISLSLIYS
jgi:hypothetical protein